MHSHFTRRRGEAMPPDEALIAGLTDVLDVSRAIVIDAVTELAPLEVEPSPDGSLPPTWKTPLLNYELPAALRGLVPAERATACMQLPRYDEAGLGRLATEWQGRMHAFRDVRDHFGRPGFFLPFLDADYLRDPADRDMWVRFGRQVEEHLAAARPAADAADTEQFGRLFPTTYGFTAEKSQLYLKWATQNPLRTGWHFEMGFFSAANVSLPVDTPANEDDEAPGGAASPSPPPPPPPPDGGEGAVEAARRRRSAVLWIAARLVDMQRAFTPKEIKELLSGEETKFTAHWLQQRGVPVWYTVQLPGQCIVSAPGTCHVVLSWGVSLHWAINLSAIPLPWLRACLRLFGEDSTDRKKQDNHAWNTRLHLPVYRTQRAVADLGLQKELAQRDARIAELTREWPTVCLRQLPEGFRGECVARGLPLDDVRWRGHCLLCTTQRLAKCPRGEDVAFLPKDVWCHCNRPDDGTPMVRCDNPGCPNGEWFHLRCVGARAPESGSGADWFCCDACAAQAEQGLPPPPPPPDSPTRAVPKPKRAPPARQPAKRRRA